jgi:cytoskeleton protein RodZ
MSESEDKKSALGSVTDTADATKLATIESGQLASARARLGLSLLDLAAETRIPKRHLTALENHQVDRLPAKLFVIGYLRTCADRLGLNLDDLLAEYGVAETVVRDATANATNADTVLAGDTAHSVLSHGPGMAPRPTVWRIAAFAIVPLLLIVFLAWIYSMQDDAVAQSMDSDVLLNIQTAPLGQLASVAVNQQAREYKVTAKAEIDVSKQLETRTERKEAVVVASALPTTEVSPVAIITRNTDTGISTDLSADSSVIDAPIASQNQSQDRLVISVKEDSWVHITDSAGSQLFRDLARAGKKIDVMGDLPFDVHLGNAPGLALELNGSPFAITDYRDDNSARLVLGSR